MAVRVGTIPVVGIVEIAFEVMRLHHERHQAWIDEGGEPTPLLLDLVQDVLGTLDDRRIGLRDLLLHLTGVLVGGSVGVGRVEDPLGRVLEEQIVRGQRSLDAGIGYQVVDMMRGVMTTGTGKVVRRMGFELPAAGKTGTSDDFRDSWFTGFTPTLSVSVWVGHDRGMSMRDENGIGITGGRGAAPIWAEFMINATNGEPAREFKIPSDIHFETVDPISGNIARQWTSNPVKIALRSGQTVAAGSDDLAGDALDESISTESDDTIIEAAEESIVKPANDAGIKEEELPPE